MTERIAARLRNLGTEEMLSTIVENKKQCFRYQEVYSENLKLISVTFALSSALRYFKFPKL